ncbi:MAG: ADP-forming succinate--CoA ligase subunit beta [Bacteroidetes bacterium]|nr:ADP-forming succinate--CoA ligase subunit beta [Rhodothermia bacterium]MCS7155636.1 ADP-forming succinate--CoA ligase subunit beta [Bacteroidota bacterium]MCX7906495.1 ADP-forming succinate--CoA ligase subunit beta [Bacteroidota bacterium]MDW8137224.1 ADP-forming succinate--CoA ligase subunit beta [Bacteroidota bacterium]MDW8284906.1 ADP-forming succinate--CoA ligase subunit beta [Bacteroidota bacterium]
MKIHEYQAKELLKRYGVAVQDGYVAFSVEEALEAAQRLERERGVSAWVVKAQIHAGGRGKAGGIKLARSLEEVRQKAQALLGARLITPQTGPEGRIVRRLFIAEALDIEREYYLGITLDRSRSQNVLMASPEGGVEIEEVARQAPEKILKEWIDPAVGLAPFQARKLAFGLGFTAGEQFAQVVRMIEALYRAYEELDCSLAEINPLVLTRDGRVLALDAKISFDDNALFRHPDYAELRDLNEEDPLEVEASRYGLNYVRLDGNVGCMVNGAGLAMATMDIIKLAGGEPANFLDVGGGASPETVEAGFRIILSDPHVKAILVNIFGGIVRCDRVAAGIIEAARKVDVRVPLIVRLQGTNADLARRMLAESGLNLIPATELEEAAQKVTQALTAQV